MNDSTNYKELYEAAMREISSLRVQMEKAGWRPLTDDEPAVGETVELRGNNYKATRSPGDDGAEWTGAYGVRFHFVQNTVVYWRPIEDGNDGEDDSNNANGG